MSTKATNDAAKAFKALHVPGTPLLLANVHDATSARIVAALPGCKALATASFAIALANGTSDPSLDLDTHLAALAPIAAAAGKKPLTVDLQDGYGPRLGEAVRAVVGLGAVGANIEDSDRASGAMMGDDEAVARVRAALAAAAAEGVPDFVVNARADSCLKGGTLEESIRRGRLYLEAGATTVYILGGGPGGFTREEVARMVEGLDGRVNVGLRLPGGSSAVKLLTSSELGELGVARVSVGPQLYLAVVEALTQAAGAVFGS